MHDDVAVDPGVLSRDETRSASMASSSSGYGAKKTVIGIGVVGGGAAKDASSAIGEIERTIIDIPVGGIGVVTHMGGIIIRSKPIEFDAAPVVISIAADMWEPGDT